MVLLIHDTLEAIQSTWAILNSTMLVYYVSHDNKMLWYMEHVLYRLEKMKIAFEDHRAINPKLCQPTFNYPKFHAISHFVQCIWNYDSAVNYDTTHSKAVHKYFLKTFYNKANKNKSDSQIWQYNVCHTNIIAMKGVIILEKKSEREKLSGNITNITTPAKMAQVLSPIDFPWKYKWAISNIDLDATRKLELTGIKKY